MPISDAKRKIDKKWRKEHYEKLGIGLPAGTRELWKQEAAKRGLSLAGMIKQAVSEFIDRTK